MNLEQDSNFQRYVESCMRKIVNGVETNAVPERMEGSSFFRLSKGDNYLQLKAANNSQNGITCEMQFTPLVSGV